MSPISQRRAGWLRHEYYGLECALVARLTGWCRVVGRQVVHDNPQMWNRIRKHGVRLHQFHRFRVNLGVTL